MFEIGSALREARERRGLSYAQVEDETKIRARYIRALEEEAFGVLPGATYTKGFLRAYADYLGLDGHLFIDEFNSRYHDPRNEDDKPIYPPSRKRLRARPPRDERGRDRAGGDRGDRIAGVHRGLVERPGRERADPAAVDALDRHQHRPAPPRAAARPPTRAPPRSSTRRRSAATRSPSPPPTATRGWPRTSGASDGPAARTVHGTDLSQYLLQQGEVAVVMTRAPVYLQLGAPGSVTVTMAGKQAQLPPGTSFKVTRPADQPGVSRPTAAILLTGSELLRGVISDLNAAHLARRLESLGFQMQRTLLVGDPLDEIEDGMRELAGRHDLVVTSGGLGPTHDDRTVEALANVARRPLEVDEDVLDQITGWTDGVADRMGFERERFQRRQPQAGADPARRPRCWAWPAPRPAL